MDGMMNATCKRVSRNPSTRLGDSGDSPSQGPVQELVAAGAKGGTSGKDVAAQVDILITMLPNSPDVELVALGRDGIIEGARPGLLFLDMSTISPIVSQKVGIALAAKG